MLDSRPDRAHAPIVSGRNLTLAAARMSAASPSVIQSAAAGTGQPSLRLDDRDSDELDEPEEPDEPLEPEEPLELEEPPEPDEPDEPEAPEDSDEPEEPDAPDFDPLDSPDPEPPSDDPFDPPSLPESPDLAPAAAARVALALPRSFLAQPEPLKWIVGAANCLRRVPSRPHDGQNCGAGSLIPWRMSERWPQAVQRYS
jgi:hypothetical protein